MVVGNALRYAELLSARRQLLQRLVRQHRWLQRQQLVQQLLWCSPRFVLSSALLVSVEDEGEAGFSLANVPLDDLLAEIKSRTEG